MADFVPELLRRKSIVAAYYTKGLWHDVGTLSSYEKVNSELGDEMLAFF